MLISHYEWFINIYNYRCDVYNHLVMLYQQINDLASMTQQPETLLLTWCIILQYFYSFIIEQIYSILLEHIHTAPMQSSRWTLRGALLPAVWVLAKHRPAPSLPLSACWLRAQWRRP